MKKLLFILLSILASMHLWAQNANYTNTSFVQNGTFTSNLTLWNSSGSAWIVNNGTAYAVGEGVSGSIEQSVNGIPVVGGYIFLTFDAKLYRNQGNAPTLTVEYNNTVYANLRRDASDNVQFNLLNNAILISNNGSWTNTNSAANPNTIILAIPVNSIGTTTNGSIKFGITSNATNGQNSYNVRVDNVQFMDIVSNMPNGANCPTCLPLTVDANGDANYNDAPPKPECKSTESGENIYKYYLPAVASMPTSLAAVDATSPANITISTEVSNATVTLYRANGTLVSTHNITPAAVLTIPTLINDMFTSTYNTPYINRGYVIESNNPITVRWGLEHTYNREAVVLRGKHAIGKSFRAASIMNADRSTGAQPAEGDHYMTVMALENNTRVQIGKNNTATVTADFVFVTLNKGQQYTVVNNTVAMSGRLVLSDKPIVLASGQQHKRIMRGDSNVVTSTSLEGTVLQVPPTYMLGKEYVIVNTEGFYGFQVVANSNATAVFRDGVALKILNAGESYQFFDSSNVADMYGKPFTISLSKPGYVYNIGSNIDGEFELFPAPPVDLPVGKAGKIIYSSANGDNGWVIVDQADAGKVKRNGSAILNPSRTWTLPARNGVNAKTVYYWNNTFTPQTINNITCDICNAMYVGQLNDGGSSGAQIGYITSFDASSIQFFNTGFMPVELLTNGYIFDTLNYYVNNPGTISHTLTIASSGGSVIIDSIGLSRVSGNTNVGSVASHSGLNFTLNTPPTNSVLPRQNDTVVTTVYVSDAARNVAAICLSYIVMNINPLPVQLLSFDAKKVNATSYLNWETGSEHDNKGFQIERSKDGRAWESIGWVSSASANGISDVKNDYQFVDENPFNGINMYRLKQMDYSDKFEYSGIRTVMFDGIESLVTLYPNPTNGNVYLEGITGKADVYIHNAASQLMLLMTVEKTKKLELKLDHFVPGVYMVQVKLEDGTMKQFKLVKE